MYTNFNFPAIGHACPVQYSPVLCLFFASHQSKNSLVLLQLQQRKSRSNSITALANRQGAIFPHSELFAKYNTTYVLCVYGATYGALGRVGAMMWALLRLAAQNGDQRSSNLRLTTHVCTYGVILPNSFVHNCFKITMI